MLENMRENRLGYCERCGDDIRPVWYRDDFTGQKELSHGECFYCGKRICVSGMTFSEYLGLPIVKREVNNG